MSEQTGLTPAQHKELRNRLLAEKDRLQSEIEALGQAVDEKADCSVSDRADAAALQERRHRAASLRAHHEQTLLEIGRALIRMNQGRYGISEASGEAITYERLKVLPWARTE